MPWISNWEMREYINLSAINRTLKTRVAALEKTETARVPKGLERLIPSASKYLTTRLIFGPQEWDLAAIERDLKHLDTYDNYQAGQALHNQLTTEGLTLNPVSWWDLRAPENSQSVSNGFPLVRDMKTHCCEHADTQKEDK